MSDAASEAAAAALVVGPESAPVPLADVETELNQRIRDLQEGTAEIVLRARMSNVVIYCNTLQQTEEINQLIPDILALHPARVLLLYGQAEGAASVLTTTVSVVAHTVRDGQKLCSEQINVRAIGTSLQKLPFVVRGLLVGDLPVNLWWAAQQPPPLGGELFHELEQDAEQIVYDSIGWPEPARGMLAVSSWVSQLEKTPRTLRWRVAADLNWRRLKYWRRILTQALDPSTAPGFLPTIREVYIEHGPHAVIQAWLLVSWLAAQLGWHVQMGRASAHVDMAWQCAGPQGKIHVRIHRVDQGGSALQRVRISGGAEAFDFVTEDGRRLAVKPEGADGVAARTLSMPEQPLAHLVGTELSDRDRDPVFHHALQMARLLAQSVVV